MRLRIGTRRSHLAMRQAELVARAVRSALPRAEVALVPMETTGDRMREVHPLSDPSQTLWGGVKGAFVREIEEALLQGEIDLAVHSAKDLPTELAAGLAVVGYLPREDPRDVVVGLPLGQLSPGDAVGTSSPRRQVQVLALRPDVRVVPMRGNVDTRLRKVAEGVCRSAVLAAAGLLRLGLSSAIAEWLDFLPAPGQGAIAVEGRLGDSLAEAVGRAVGDAATAAAVEAERGFLRAMGGGCATPLGAWGRVQDGRLVLEGFVGSAKSGRLVRDQVAGPADAPADLGRELARRLLAAGGAALVAEAGPP